MAKITSAEVISGIDAKKGQKVTLEQVIPKAELVKPIKTEVEVPRDSLMWIKVDKLEDARGRSAIQNNAGEEATFSILFRHVDLAVWREVLADIKRGDKLKINVETYE